MFDFASAGGMKATPDGINDKGLVSATGWSRKTPSTSYRANGTRADHLYRQPARRRADSAATAVKIYSNCEKVTLKVNGKSMGEPPWTFEYVFVRDAVTAD